MAYLLHHLADSETVLYERVRRVISEPAPQRVAVFDQDAWAARLDYSRIPIAQSRAVYEAVRGALIDFATRFYESHAATPFVHSTLGERTLGEEFDKVADHNRLHLGHIGLALARHA